MNNYMYVKHYIFELSTIRDTKIIISIYLHSIWSKNNVLYNQGMMACMFNKGENCIAAGEYDLAAELVKQLLEVFVLSRIIKVKVGLILTH